MRSENKDLSIARDQNKVSLVYYCFWKYCTHLGLSLGTIRDRMFI